MQNELVTLKMNCCFCGNAHEVTAYSMDIKAYNNGTLVQRAFPYLNATQREQIISHICPECQKSVFGS